MPGTPGYGRALEQLIAGELRAYLSYRHSDEPLTYFRSRSQIEVDFVIGDRIAIEVKASGRVSDRDARGLSSLAEDVRLQKKIIVCTERTSRRFEAGIDVIPAVEFLDRLWRDEIV